MSTVHWCSLPLRCPAFDLLNDHGRHQSSQDALAATVKTRSLGRSHRMVSLQQSISWYMLIWICLGTPKKVKPIPPIPYRFQWWMSHWEKQDIVFSKSRWWTNLDTNVNSGPKDFAHTDWEKVPSNGKKLNADADIKNQVLVCQSQGTCFNPQGCWLSYSLVRPGNWKEPVQEVHHINERGMFGNHMQFPERNHMHSPLSADTTAGISILTVITSWNSDWFNTYERKFKWKRNKPVVYTYMLHCIYVYIYIYNYIHIT